MSAEWYGDPGLPLGWNRKLAFDGSTTCVHGVQIGAKCIECSEGWIKREQEEKEKYSAGGLRYDAGKLDWTAAPWDLFERMMGEKVDWDLLTPMVPALAEVVRVLQAGEKRYARNNWHKGISFRRNLAAAFRHWLKFLRGEDRDADPDFLTYHTANAVCSLLFIGTFLAEGRSELDDRKGPRNRPATSQADDSWRGTGGERGDAEGSVCGSKRPGADPDAPGRGPGSSANPAQ